MALAIVPANEAACADLRAVFGSRGPAANCRCQRYKLRPREAFAKFPVEERDRRLREQTACGSPGSPTTSGLVAYLEAEPVGWCAVEPRPAYVGLVRNNRVPWEGRDEDRADDSVWSVTCVFVRAGYRGRGIAYALARAAVDFAQSRGARAVEAYPLRTEPGQRISWDEIHVGSPAIFAAAGLVEVSHPTVRRIVMRLDFQGRRSSRLGASPEEAERMVEEGAPAPEFSLPSDSGGTVSLADLRGAPVVLYVYPKDDTPRAVCSGRGVLWSLAGFGLRRCQREAI
jgi:GNAT superfamily N-acetyltransferase